jgi:hypothetical protein
MTQPYIAGPRFDLPFIIGPAFLVTAIAVAAAPWAETLSQFPVWLWVVLILGVDVSHVYSTIFRTYLDRDELHTRPRLYQLTPLLLWLTGALLYAIDGMVFWRALAYLAIFHFVRQQYGFMMIYARRETGAKWLDQAVIYGATAVPLVYWLTHERSFNWFIEGDIPVLALPWLSWLAAGAYAVVLAIYLWREFGRWRVTQQINVPKNLLLFGTILSWSVGIVAFDNDIVFTATNVVAHGIPYLALNWLYGDNRQHVQATSGHVSRVIDALFRPAMIPVYILGLALLAFVEEGLWDGLVWRDHESLFGAFKALPEISDPHTLIWLVPLLSLPQSVHYVLDAFIWRKDGNTADFGRILFHRARHD